MIAWITDLKSTFTADHSRGIVEKARRMGEYYGYDRETCLMLYLAGAFHDVGKLMVPTDILEKPGRLTGDEFSQMKYHAQASWDILGRIRGFETIRLWAGYHHEKLDGSGYPFDKSADELDHTQRLMARIDIYQALTEYRPYRKSSTHAEAISMMKEDAAKGKIDGAIVEDVDRCFG